jgi:hypothetical protein
MTWEVQRGSRVLATTRNARAKILYVLGLEKDPLVERDQILSSLKTRIEDAFWGSDIFRIITQEWAHPPEYKLAISHKKSSLPEDPSLIFSEKVTGAERTLTVFKNGAWQFQWAKKSSGPSFFDRSIDIKIRRDISGSTFLEGKVNSSMAYVLGIQLPFGKKMCFSDQDRVLLENKTRECQKYENRDKNVSLNIEARPEGNILIKDFSLSS